MMEAFLPLVSGLAIGVVLGLLGGGGGLMAIPILLYLFKYPFRMAVGSSLALVVLGVIPALILYSRKRQIDWRAAAFMGMGGMAGALGGSQLSGLFPQQVLLWLLILLMAFSAWKMLVPTGLPAGAGKSLQEPQNLKALVLSGLGIGILTGLVGVGGGFLLVPALLWLGGLSSRQAIATSLVVIGANALSGSIGYARLLPLDSPSFWWLVAGSLTGGVSGFALSFQLPEPLLKKSFGFMLLGLICLLLLVPPAGF